MILNGQNVCLGRFTDLYRYLLFNNVNNISLLPGRLHNTRGRTNTRLPTGRIDPLITRSEGITMQLGPIFMYIPSSYL